MVSFDAAHAAVPQVYPNDFTGPHGFPLWVRYCHFFNFVFVMMLIRSGLSILVDHPRLYFNSDCTPNSEWIRLTPILIPTDRVWTAKDDARHISPMVATPRSCLPPRPSPSIGSQGFTIP
jgi:sulfoxide reductase catalytic subunit YedY